MDVLRPRYLYFLKQVRCFSSRLHVAQRVCAIVSRNCLLPARMLSFSRWFNSRFDVPEAELTHVLYKGRRHKPSFNPEKIDSFDYVNVKQLIRDARCVEPSPTIEAYGFQLLKHETKLKREDFNFTSQKTIDRYYKEVEAAVKNVFPKASEVIVFNHQVRSAIADTIVEESQENSSKDTAGVLPPTGLVHCDYNSFGALQIFDDFVRPEDRKGRFLLVNVWRNISDHSLVENDHLAVCDGRTVAAPDDFVTVDFDMQDSVVEIYMLDPGRKERHQWYFYPNMAKEEALLFVEYDSDCDSPARFTFHASFKDPNAAKDLPPRESIECRCIVSIPDHKPDTIPHNFKKETVDLVNHAAKRILESLRQAKYWPEMAKRWVGFELYREDGAARIATRVVKESAKRHIYGLENASEQQINDVIERCLSGGAFEKLAKANFKKVPVEQALVPHIMKFIENPEIPDDDKKLLEVGLNDKASLGIVLEKILNHDGVNFLGKLTDEEQEELVNNLLSQRDFKNKLKDILKK